MNHKAMHMADWVAKLDDFLKLSDREILPHAGRVSHDEATAKAEQEYERFAEERAALPSPGEKHFEEAMQGVKRLERARHTKLELPKPKRGKKP